MYDKLEDFIMAWANWVLPATSVSRQDQATILVDLCAAVNEREDLFDLDLTEWYDANGDLQQPLTLAHLDGMSIVRPLAKWDGEKFIRNYAQLNVEKLRTAIGTIADEYASEPLVFVHSDDWDTGYSGIESVLTKVTGSGSWTSLVDLPLGDVENRDMWMAMKNVLDELVYLRLRKSPAAATQADTAVKEEANRFGDGGTAQEDVDSAAQNAWVARVPGAALIGVLAPETYILWRQRIFKAPADNYRAFCIVRDEYSDTISLTGIDVGTLVNTRVLVGVSLENFSEDSNTATAVWGGDGDTYSFDLNDDPTLPTINIAGTWSGAFTYGFDSVPTNNPIQCIPVTNDEFWMGATFPFYYVTHEVYSELTYYGDP